MKRILLILLILNIKSFGQGFPRHYKDNFGNNLTLNVDSTFIAKWEYDLTIFWQTGSWTMKNDTIYFYPRHVFDTLFCNNKDSLILSSDLKSNRIPCDQSQELVGHSSFQKDSIVPSLLFVESDRLFKLNEDRSLIKKESGKQKKISIRKNKLEKSEIVLISWRKKIPAYYILEN